MEKRMKVFFDNLSLSRKDADRHLMSVARQIVNYELSIVNYQFCLENSEFTCQNTGIFSNELELGWKNARILLFLYITNNQ